MSNLRFDVEFTNVCNARCVFCPYSRMTRPIGYISWETWERIVEQAKVAGILRLTVAGFGEPTIHTQLTDFLRWARAELPDTWLQLVTNASLLWRMDLDALGDARLTDIVISFNGFSPESYEHLMSGLSFKEVLRGMSLLAKRLQGTETVIKIRGIRFPPDPEASRQKTVAFLRSLGFEPRANEFYPLHNRGGGVYSYDAPANRVCEEFANTLAIGWDGSVPLCIGDMLHLNLVGNIREDTALELHKRCLAARRVPETQQKLCAHCDIAEVFRPVFGAPVG